MPRLNIIVLDRKTPGAWAYVLWVDVPAGRQAFYANPTAASLWKDALPVDLTNLRSGAVIEQQGQINTPGFTQASLQAELQTRWATLQAAVTAYNPWNFYGSMWNGVTWTVTGAP